MAKPHPILPYVRSLSNPKIGLYMDVDPLTHADNSYVVNTLPDCYLGNNWNNLVTSPTLSNGHFAAGVVNKWFHLLCTGDGTPQQNEVGNTYTVNKINFSEAEAILYLAETQYLIGTAKFLNLRAATIRAAIENSYLGSPQEIAVTNAWYAVNVGPAYTPQTPPACYSSTYTPLANNLTTNNYTGGIYQINNNTEINGNVTFTNTIIQIASGASITIMDNSTLTLRGCCLKTCTGMWEGITVKRTGKLLIDANNTRSSLIQDAKVAVYYDDENYATSYNGKIVDIKNTIFNRNEVSIKVENFDYRTSNINTEILAVNNCLFTSRDIVLKPNNTWDNIATIKGLTTSTTPNTYSSPYITSITYADNAVAAYLKDIYTFGYTTNKPQAGIVLNNVNDATANGLGAVIGSGLANSTNIFDNLNTGIDATNSNLTVNNCTFQKPAGSLIFKRGILVKNSIDKIVNIDAPSGTPANAFFDMDMAIEISGSKKTTVKGCEIRSSQSIADIGTYTSNKGSFGININNYNFESIDVKDNKLYNIRNGVNFLCTRDRTPNDPLNPPTPINIGTVNINDNYIKKQLAGATATGNEYVENAINLSSLYLNNDNNKVLSCINNTIDGALNGIKASNFQNKDLDIQTNNITLIAHPTNSNYPAYGICVEGGSGFGGTNISSKVKDNTITGTGIANNATGILLSQQANTAIECNTVNQSQNGYKFMGLCPDTKFTDNYISITNQNGVYLENAIIGRQGKDGDGGIIPADICPSNNSWINDANWWVNTSPRQYMIYNNLTNPADAEFVVRGTGKFNPHLGGTSFDPIQDYRIGTGLILATGGDGINCTRCVGAPARIANITDVLAEIAAGTVLLPNDNPQKRLEVMQQQLYELVQTNPELANSSTDIQQFVQQNQWQSFDFIHYLSYYAGKGNMDMVNILLNYWTPTNSDMENTYNTYFNWLVAMHNNPAYTPEAEQVREMGNRCPTKYGTIVYAIRNLYNAITKQIYQFTDNCNEGQARGTKMGMIRVRQPKANESIATVANKLTLIPNPASTTLKVISNGINKVEVVNILGMVMLQQKTNGSKQIELNISHLQNGIYLLRAFDSNNKPLISKFLKQ